MKLPRKWVKTEKENTQILSPGALEHLELRKTRRNQQKKKKEEKDWQEAVRKVEKEVTRTVKCIKAK